MGFLSGIFGSRGYVGDWTPTKFKKARRDLQVSYEKAATGIQESELAARRGHEGSLASRGLSGVRTGQRRDISRAAQAQTGLLEARREKAFEGIPKPQKEKRKGMGLMGSILGSLLFPGAGGSMLGGLLAGGKPSPLSLLSMGMNLPSFSPFTSQGRFNLPVLFGKTGVRQPWSQLRIHPSGYLQSYYR